MYSGSRLEQSPSLYQGHSICYALAATVSDRIRGNGSGYHHAIATTTTLNTSKRLMEYMLVRAGFLFNLCQTLKTPYDHQQPQVIRFPVITSTPVASQDLPAIHDL
jgi:hypothetical protein